MTKFLSICGMMECMPLIKMNTVIASRNRLKYRTIEWYNILVYLLKEIKANHNRVIITLKILELHY